MSPRNANGILGARQQTEQELLRAKDDLELMTRELATSLAMMRATLESTTDGILAVDGQGNVSSFNERFVQMWRVPREMLASGDQRLLRSARGQLADPDAYTAKLDEIYATLPPESFDVLEFADGRVFERHSQIQRVDQRNVGRVWSFRDITERRRSEEALREESRSLELLNRTGMAVGSTMDLKKLVQAVPLDDVSILVIDDEADARELIKHVLVQCRANVFTASTADDGLQLLAVRGADVVISDIGMPGKDGYEFIRLLRALPASKGGNIPAIALTAFARSEDRTRAMVSGYQVHVSKPIEPQELVATVASLAGRAGQRKH